MNAIRLFWLLFISLVSAQEIHATHIVGGEITYRCLGNDQYEITLTVYRDCFNGKVPFDSTANIGIYQGGKDSVFLKLGLLYDETTNDTLPIILDNPCLVVPPGVCVHKATYQTVLNLPYAPAGYTIAYQRCCRNELIRNIPFPLNTGISFIAEISGKAQLECNSAATFKQWPPVAICIHVPINFDHAASDPDGDSLRYRLCTPLNGPDFAHSVPDPPAGPPYEELNWIDPPFNLQNIMGGDPLSIDSISGFMTGIPNTLGNFVVGVCVDEFRDDSLLSTTRRDFQYNVADCGLPTAAFFTQEVHCDTLSIQFENLSHNATSFEWFFDWPDDLSQNSFAYAPLHTFPDTGEYLIALVALPNTMCSDTFFFPIQLVETQGNLLVTADPAEITRGATSQLSADFPGATAYFWAPAINLSDQHIYNPLASPLETTPYFVTATLPNGCEKSGQITLAVIPPACDEPYVFFPSAFSPNGDDQNDVLKMESNIVSEVYWVIYNRWGEKIFEANSLSDAWDGTFRGEPQPVETYGYYLRVKCTDGKESVKKGNVTLLR